MYQAVRVSALSVLLAGAVAAGPFLVSHQARAQTPTFSGASPTSNTTATKRDTAVEKRIAYLHTQLKITPDEEKTFDGFADVMRANAAQMDGLVEKRTAMRANATAVDQLNAYTEMAQAHAQNMQQLSSAFATLYGSLTPQQKKMADQDFRRFGNEQRTARS